MANPELRGYYGEANFRLDAGAVPDLSVEKFNPYTDTEEKDFVRATINSVQGRKKIEQLKAHFNQELTTEGEA
ncbi:MAG TPA: hypothetical protein VN778_02910 [Verrucomicrobiae bacterium]|nr:hypothetical protein [Verrucomicrobiae bacterium]